MRIHHRSARLAFAGLGVAAGISCLATVLAGCGGAGGSVAAATSRAATLSVYVTDGFSDQYKQVLVTLYGIDVSTNGGKTWTTVYSDSAGQTIDLESLSTTAQLLSTVNVPATAVTNVRLTVGATVTLAPTSGTSKTVTLDPTAPNITISGSEAIITVAAPTALQAGQLSNLALDFNLAAFQLVNGALRPSIGLDSPSAFEGKSKIAHIPGTISALTSTGFTLSPVAASSGTSSTTASGLAVTVSSTTTIAAGAIPLVVSSNGAAIGTMASASLAVGDSVIVEGTVDPTTGSVTAKEVLILPAVPENGGVGSAPGINPGGPILPGGGGASGSSGGQSGELSAIGSIGSVSTDGSATFTLQVQDGQGFATPMGSFIVQTGSTTVFQSSGSPSTFSALTAGATIAVIGTIDATSGDLDAQYVILLPGNISTPPVTLPGGVIGSGGGAGVSSPPTTTTIAPSPPPVPSPGPATGA